MRSLLARVKALESASQSADCTCHVPRKIIQVVQRAGVSDEEVERQVAERRAEVRNPPDCPVHPDHRPIAIIVRGIVDPRACQVQEPGHA